MLWSDGATVAERLARSPPTKVKWAQYPARSPDFRKWKSCRMMPLVGGFFSGILCFPQDKITSRGKILASFRIAPTDSTPLPDLELAASLTTSPPVMRQQVTPLFALQADCSTDCWGKLHAAAAILENFEFSRWLLLPLIFMLGNPLNPVTLSRC
ncbi:hypothetical protein PR048_006464 [Dryococelus australis]|uniref:Uncharacterized protein n=1 Tax=Dryococelus australis TaxID=614101 RepID=A0ABQ9IB59_9NEOP|nr:hypothetical protein PR048_006464 [Dryococelus australis]